MRHLVAFSVLIASLCLMECLLTKAEFVEENSAPQIEQGYIGHFARSSAVPCRQHYRDLANYLVELAKEAMAKASDSQPCERKRNSELINSLLGLPKVMNDAGRK